MAHKILIVDDDVMMLTILSKALGKEGYDVYVAKNGTEGLGQVRGGRFDLVVSDINMPDINGLDVLREIKLISPSTMVINNDGLRHHKRRGESHPVGGAGIYRQTFSS
jgi:CheY-like chemotaxis protein